MLGVKQLHQSPPPIGHITNLYWAIINPATLVTKNGQKLEAGMELQIFCLLPECFLCECLLLAIIPSTPVPNSTLQHCYMTFVMLISWSRGRSGQVQKCTFSLPNRVQSMHRAPHSPPECRISRKCQWFRYNIKYLALQMRYRGLWIGWIAYWHSLGVPSRPGDDRGGSKNYQKASIFEVIVDKRYNSGQPYVRALVLSSLSGCSCALE